MNWLSDRTITHLRQLSGKPDFSQTKYQIVQQLARGGMGTVYIAHDQQLNREVAIKVINAEQVDDETTQRMVREAQIVARLEHPGIVPIHDVGVLPDGRIFYAMKLVRGDRLDDYAKLNSSNKDRLRKFQSICEAVAFAHSNGVVHRDLKPQNIMIGSFGEVLVLDWGVAKMLSSEVETLRKSNSKDVKSQADTSQGTVIGTPHFMSPEQARGEIDNLDQRADVYSLGAILYFLLTNQLPARAGDGKSSIHPRIVDSKISKTAEAVCLKAMSEAPVQRYSNAANLAEDVNRLINGEPVAAYRENVFEIAARWLNKNRFLVFLVLAYLLMRLFFLLTAHR